MDLIYTINSNMCISFVQSWTKVEYVGPTLYKCYVSLLCLVGKFIAPPD